MRRRKTTPSLVDLDDAASSRSHTSPHVSHARVHTIDLSEHRPAKRRKVAGLNARYDRMIKSVNTVLSYRANSPRSGSGLSRKTLQSSSTSSVSSHDIPKTPMDASNSLHPGRLGSDFSLSKTKKSHPLLQNDADRFLEPVAPPKEPKTSLPDWLANTFCGLEKGHPLRGLLSPARINAEPKPSLPPAESLGGSHEEDVFAFSPFDKQEARGVTYHAEITSNASARGHVSSIVPKESTLSHLELEVSTSPLPFSTPGCFATVRKLSVIDATFQKPLIPVPQQVASRSSDMTHPPALPVSPLRSGDVIGRPKAFSNLIQDSEYPSDLQDHGANTNYHCQGVFQGDCDNLSVYGTPGPTFACSRPVYFDSPTEDPSLSDPLQPESYELDLNTIDFCWHPFLRSNAPERDTNRCLASPFPQLGHTVSNQVAVNDQNGWNTHFDADKGEYGTSSEDHPSLPEDMNITCSDNAGVVRPSNVNATTAVLSTINHTIGPWSSPINDVQEMRPTFLPSCAFLSPLRDKPVLLAGSDVLPRGDGENIQANEGLHLAGGEGVRSVELDAHGIRPSTPTRQAPISLPGTPQKLRAAQLRKLPQAPALRTSSALSWMIPLKPSKKRAFAARDDVEGPISCVSVNSHDSIESWGE